MTTDRELLELAAKAAGIYENATAEDIAEFYEPGGLLVLDGYWNPLTDDGDALRLAVKLGIDFYQGDDDGPAAYAGYFIGTRQLFATAQHNDDPYAATRRAIVRAAAEIGKTMS